MEQSFMDQLKKHLDNGDGNVSVTENGAIGYKTTGKKLLDLNFSTSSMRGKSDEDISFAFSEACADNVDAAIVWLFFARDVRGGMGERKLFRVCTKFLAREFPEKLKKVLHLIPEYGRWDDLIELVQTSVSYEAVKILRTQLVEDIGNMRAGKSVSLLAKWMPSENTSSIETKKKASVIRQALRFSPRSYRVMLSSLRRYIGVVEVKMSANKWVDIDYSAVPSKANLIYKEAFLRHDEERRKEYLDALENGAEKIHSSALFPYEIVNRYNAFRSPDQALEAMWKALPNTAQGGENTIVVADGSGSMLSRVSNAGNVRSIDVAHSLAIYFAEKLPEPYHNKYVTFSSRPQFVDLSGSSTLFGKLRTAYHYGECANTNIERVFDLILRTAVENHLKQEEIPKNILIISDMEFDEGTERTDARLFSQIDRRYQANGYSLPRLVFWNVCGRTGTIPVKENNLGVALVSGFSPNIASMVFSGKTDPMETLLDMLNSDRYLPVRLALSESGKENPKFIVEMA